MHEIKHEQYEEHDQKSEELLPSQKLWSNDKLRRVFFFFPFLQSLNFSLKLEIGQQPKALKDASKYDPNSTRH